MIDTKDTSTHHYDDELQFNDFDMMDEAVETKPKATSIHSDKPTTEATSGFGGNSKWDSLLSQTDSHRKWIVIGIVIVLIIIFVIYHLFSQNDHSHGVSATDGTAASIKPIDQVALSKPAGPTPQQVTEALTTKLGAVDQTVNQQQQTITQLQSTISTLQDSVNALNSTVGTVSQQLTALNDKLVKPAAPPVAKKTVVKADMMMPAPITYTVKALVPGRAWLQASNGKVLTVAAGNAVPEHGEVTQIDLNAGQVMTSDGSVFTYDINGN